MLTDTYGDTRELILYDAEAAHRETLGHFASSGISKCDLHPRWDRDERRIAVDVMPGSRRKMVVLEQRSCVR